MDEMKQFCLQLSSTVRSGKLAVGHARKVDPLCLRGRRGGKLLFEEAHWFHPVVRVGTCIGVHQTPRSKSIAKSPGGNPSFWECTSGFTLVELLVVMGVMIVLLGLLIPVFQGASQGSGLSLAGQNLASALSGAREEALAENRKVNVRLLKVQDGSGTQHYRAAQIWIVKDDSGTMVPEGAIVRFPTGVVLSESSTVSPLLQAPPAQPGNMSVAGVSTDYLSFFFTVNGVPDSPISSANSFLTLVQEKDVNSNAPVNFFSLFINPVTGEISTYRP